ncbi:MAG: hypothetical protein CMJ54_06405 [Planctomycetaceae bacterium]|nr:hypothetical protein [Planctomycetaceae bacterium]
MICDTAASLPQLSHCASIVREHTLPQRSSGEITSGFEQSRVTAASSHPTDAAPQAQRQSKDIMSSVAQVIPFDR